MIKLLAIFFIIHTAVCQLQDLDSTENSKCPILEGSTNTYLACYICGDERLKHRQNKIVEPKLSLVHQNNSRIELCCINQTNLVGRRGEEVLQCGLSNPNGKPRAKRLNARTVLEREYPWRAWVYSSKKEEALCAATYVYRQVYALLTTASCVSGFQPSDLYVKFTKTQQNPDRVKDVVLHENFTTSTGGNKNDIAMLTLTAPPDSRVQPVCLDEQKLMLGLSCVVVSANDSYINPIAPGLKKCKTNNVTTEHNVICTLMAKGDHVPQHSTGLYCLNEVRQSAAPIYTLQGIYQSNQNEGTVAVYTSMSRYINWVNNNSKRLSEEYGNKST